jgi:hypothetical protein
MTTQDTFGVFVKGRLIQWGAFSVMKDVLKATPHGVMKRCVPPSPPSPLHYEVVKVLICDKLGEIEMARKRKRGGVKRLKAELKELQSMDWRP